MKARNSWKAWYVCGIFYVITFAAVMLVDEWKEIVRTRSAHVSSLSSHLSNKVSIMTELLTPPSRSLVKKDPLATSGGLIANSNHAMRVHTNKSNHAIGLHTNYSQDLTYIDTDAFDSRSKMSDQLWGCDPMSNLTDPKRREIFESRLSRVEPEILRKYSYPGLDVHVRKWGYPINVAGCGSSVKNLIIAVPSGVKGHKSRDAVRATWGHRRQLQKLKSRLIFVVGVTRDPKLQKAIKDEALKYKDIVQIDTYDSYYNLSLKTIGLLHWTRTYCSQAKIVAKIDEDVLANIPNVIKHGFDYIKKYDKFIAGVLQLSGRPHTNGKWVDRLFKPLYATSNYPDYLAGPAYLMPTSILPELLCFCNTQPYHILEDVFVTGWCADGVPLLKKIEMPGIFNDANACRVRTRSFTLSHSYDPSGLIRTWDIWKSRTKECM